LLSSFFLLPDTIAIKAVYPTKTHLTIQVACLLKNAACPLCQHPSERIHGSYGRTVADVPCGGRRVTLALTVRKFVCGTPDCPRKIFTERLPALVQSYARMTNRLRDALVALGLATSAEVSERLAPSLGMLVIFTSGSHLSMFGSYAVITMLQVGKRIQIDGSGVATRLLQKGESEEKENVPIRFSSGLGHGI
jgi:hypothetical protein